ncbi:MAG: MAPEG family protein [Xanthobacteraceae bacterium]
MSLQAVLLPLFVEVILTFVLMLRMGALRRADYRSGAVKADDIALREPRWPARTTQAANAFANQFELPVLFYVLTILSWVTRHAGIVFVVLAWIFVICRVLQAYVHVTSNVVRYRSLFFSVGAVVLMVMWALYIIEVLTGVII